MRKSKIFGNKELELVEERIKGSKKDPNGLWANKVKPKVTEIVEVWTPRKKELKKTIKKGDKK